MQNLKASLDILSENTTIQFGHGRPHYKITGQLNKYLFTSRKSDNHYGQETSCPTPPTNQHKKKKPNSSLFPNNIPREYLQENILIHNIKTSLVRVHQFLKSTTQKPLKKDLRGKRKKEGTTFGTCTSFGEIQDICIFQQDGVQHQGAKVIF